MKLILILFFLILYGSSQAQLPNPFHRSVSGLSKKFLRKYSDDSLRTVAIYKWINRYIKYDYKAYKKHKWKVNSYSLNRMLYRRKAICYGFSELFQKICEGSNISCVLLEGYTREDKDDPYHHYYYTDHAWNAVRLNDHWYLCDLTWDNGYIITRKRPVLTLLNKIIGSPYIYSKSKFKHKPTQKYCLKGNSKFYSAHYPALPNALLSQPNISMEEFRKDSLPEYADYSSMMDPVYTNPDVYITQNTIEQLRTTAQEALRRNPNNHLSITVNYYNILVYKGDLSLQKYSSTVDSIKKYGSAFLRDNQYIHSINVRRISREHNSLLGLLRKVSSKNETNTSFYRMNAKLYKQRDKLAQKRNERRETMDELAYDNILKGRTAVIKRTDTLTYNKLLAQHMKNKRLCDSLKNNYTADSLMLEQLFKKQADLFKKLYIEIDNQTYFLLAGCGLDMNLTPYPGILPFYLAADSMSTILNKYKDSINVLSRKYLQCRNQAIRSATYGFRYAQRDYKITSMIQKNFSINRKDNLVYAYEAKSQLRIMKKKLSIMYKREERLYQRLQDEYKSLYKRFRKNRSKINFSIAIRFLALKSRMYDENTRFKAYNKQVSSILQEVSVIKK